MPVPQPLHSLKSPAWLLLAVEFATLPALRSGVSGSQFTRLLPDAHQHARSQGAAPQPQQCSGWQQGVASEHTATGQDHGMGPSYQGHLRE